FAQLRQVFRRMPVEEGGVQAVGRVQAGRGGADFAQLRPARRVHRRDQLPGDAGGTRAFQHRRAVGIEVGRVEVAVAVDQQHGHSRGAGFLRSFQPASSSVPRPSRISSANGTKSGTTRSTRNSAADSRNSRGKPRRDSQRSNRASRGLAMAAAGRMKCDHASRMARRTAQSCAGFTCRSRFSRDPEAMFSHGVLQFPATQRVRMRTGGSTMKSNTLAIALAALLVGGVAVAAFQNNRTGDGAFLTNEDAALAADEAEGRGLEYAQVVAVDPVTESRELYATVIGTEPVRETSTNSVPREV